MIKIHIIHADDRQETIEGRSGQSLMQAAVDANIEGIDADCGGSLTCATCHVIVDPAWQARLSQASKDELGLLDFTAVAKEEGSRLSCQIALNEGLDGLTVRLPASQH